MKLPIPAEFLRYLNLFLATQRRSAGDVALFLAPYLHVLVSAPRGIPRDSAPSTPIDLQAAIEPLLEHPIEDEPSARAVAANLFFSVLDLAERRVLPDLDPLLGAALLMLLDPDWRVLRDRVLQRLGWVLFRTDPNPKATAFEFLGYEFEQTFKSNGRSFAAAIDHALRETGKAGGLAKTHSVWFLAARRRASGPEGMRLPDDASARSDDPLEAAIRAEESERRGLKPEEP